MRSQTALWFFFVRSIPQGHFQPIFWLMLIKFSFKIKKRHHNGVSKVLNFPNKNSFRNVNDSAIKYKVNLLELIFFLNRKWATLCKSNSAYIHHSKYRRGIK